MKHQYAVAIEKRFNIFGAWIATDVILYKLSKNSKWWKPIASWSYDAIISRTLSMHRAERKAIKLIYEYNACRI